MSPQVLHFLAALELLIFILALIFTQHSYQPFFEEVQQDQLF